MPTYFQALVLGLLQGVSELFPVSSLGHSVIVPSLFGWQLDQASQDFLPFLVATHAATALALVIFFRKDWGKILKGLWRSITMGRLSRDPYARVGWLLILGTIPAGLLGLLLEKRVELLFASAQIAAAFLILNGIILLFADRLSRKVKHVTEAASAATVDTQIAKLTWKQSVGIGLVQSVALIPGLSRSGSAMVGGLWAGLTAEEAARFSFLLATPIIGAAALLKLPHLLKIPLSQSGPAWLGALMAGLAAWISVRFLIQYFQTKRLSPFGWYCIVAGALASLILILR